MTARYIVDLLPMLRASPPVMNTTINISSGCHMAAQGEYDEHGVMSGGASVDFVGHAYARLAAEQLSEFYGLE